MPIVAYLHPSRTRQIDVAIEVEGKIRRVLIECTDFDISGDKVGLALGGSCKDGKVTRYVFDVPTSEQKHWLQWMKEQRLLYRLALGQRTRRT